MRRIATAPGAIVLLGVLLLAAGGIGDLVFHGLPDAVSLQLVPLVGQDGSRAHLVTAAGAGVVLFGWLYNVFLVEGPPR